MDIQGRFLNWLYYTPLSDTATRNIITGTVCPCMAAGRPNEYSEEWHRNNLTAEDCLNTGIIDPTKATTQTSFKALFLPPELFGSSVPEGKTWLDAIGEINKGDLLFWGCVNASSVAEVSLTGATYTDYIASVTRDSVDYYIREVFEITNLGTCGRLKRKA